MIRPTGLPESASRPLVTPLSPSVAYASDTPDALDAQYEGRSQGYTYAREGHPNADVVAARLDAREGVCGGIVTGSGMAAVACVLMSGEERAALGLSEGFFRVSVGLEAPEVLRAVFSDAVAAAARAF